MKSIEYYMGLPYRLEITPDLDEGGFVARYPELPGCITVGDSMEEIAEYAEDAKREWLAAALDNGIAIAEPASYGNYSGQFKLRIPKSLHRSLAEHAKEESISMNQYCVYLLSKNDALESMRKLSASLSKKITFGSSLRLSSDYNLSELSYGQTTKQYGDQSLAIKGLPKNDSLRQTLSPDLALAV